MTKVSGFLILTLVIVFFFLTHFFIDFELSTSHVKVSKQLPSLPLNPDLKGISLREQSLVITVSAQVKTNAE